MRIALTERFQADGRDLAPEERAAVFEVIAPARSDATLPLYFEIAAVISVPAP